MLLASRRRRLKAMLMQVNIKGSEANLNFPGMLNEQIYSFARPARGRRHRTQRAGDRNLRRHARQARRTACRVEGTEADARRRFCAHAQSAACAALRYVSVRRLWPAVTDRSGEDGLPGHVRLLPGRLIGNSNRARCRSASGHLVNTDPVEDRRTPFPPLSGDTTRLPPHRAALQNFESVSARALMLWRVR